MREVKSTSDELRNEYKRSDFKKLERGRYYGTDQGKLERRRA